ncbi:MAG: zinc ribbon domain-containing protein [Candidatus Heimdallarchaeaceae archaeon]
MPQRRAKKLCKCTFCSKENHYESLFCVNCGMVLICVDYICSNCNEIIKRNDERCYSCGAEIENTEPPEIDLNHIDQKEKEEFIKILSRNFWGVEFDFFEKDIWKMLDYYSTIKRLFSKDCPKELYQYYGIKNINKINEYEREKEIIDKLSKSFFALVMSPAGFIDERYARIGLSVLMYIGKKYGFNSEMFSHIRILILLKLAVRYYEQILVLIENKETAIYVYTNIILNTTLQLSFYNELIKAGEVRTTRAEALYRLGEEMNDRGLLVEGEEIKRKLRKESDFEIKEETESLYYYSLNDMEVAVRIYWNEGDFVQAKVLLNMILKKLPKYAPQMKRYSPYSILADLMELFTDYYELVWRYQKEQLNDVQIEIIKVGYEILSEINYRGNKGKALSVFNNAIKLFEGLILENLEKFWEKKFMQNALRYIINYYFDNVKKLEEKVIGIIDKIEQKRKNEFLEILVGQMKKEKPKQYKEIIQKLDERK